MKSLIDDSVITCDEIIDTAETMPINSNDEKSSYKMDYYIWHTFLLVTILLLKNNIIIVIISQNKKTYYHINNIKMDSNKNLKEIDIKNRTYYYFDDILNIHDLDLDNISLDEKSYENFLIYDVAYKTPYSAKPLRIIFDEVNGHIRKYDSTKYLGLFHSDERYERIFN